MHFGRLTIFLVAPAIAFAACSSSQPNREVWVAPTTEVRVTDPAGRETSGRDLAAEVWGRGAGDFETADWAEIEAALRASRLESQPVGLHTVGPSGPVRAPLAPYDYPSRTPPASRGAPAVPGPSGAPAAESDARAGSQDPVQDPAPGEVSLVESQAEAETAVRQNQERRAAEARLRIAFGDAILLNPDGTVTKQYFLSSETGEIFVNLLRPMMWASGEVWPRSGKFGGGQLDSVLGRMLGPRNEVEIVYVDKFETIHNVKPRGPDKTTQATVSPAPSANSLLLVTARPEGLAAFEKALNLFYANIPQVQIQVKVVEYQEGSVLSFGVKPIPGTPTLQNSSSSALIRSLTSDFPLTVPLSGAGSVDDRGLIQLGGIHESWELNAALELLEIQNKADIKSQPTMVVRNGGIATVATTTAEPFPQARISNQTVTSTNIEFKDVGVIMDIQPQIAGTETVVLHIYISVSAVTGFAPTTPVPTPIIVTREAATSVHLEKGQSTVIGGLVSEASLDSETKIPILGDIPILGYLFRSTNNQKQRTILEFHITPEILVGPRGTSSFGTEF